jgi:hypothetical protein
VTDQSGDGLTRGELAQRLHSNPEWYDEEPADCCICGRDAVPVSWDGVFVPTPNGSTCLYLNEPSCLSCRVDAAETLQQRGPNQKGLSDFGGEARAD